jgi:hypothetical protein
MAVFVWCYKVGIFLHVNIKPLLIKKNRRRAESISKTDWITLRTFLKCSQTRNYRCFLIFIMYLKIFHKKTLTKLLFCESLKVPRAGVEPAHPEGHMALNHACLPIPAPGHIKYSYKPSKLFLIIFKRIYQCNHK